LKRTLQEDGEQLRAFLHEKKKKKKKKNVMFNHWTLGGREKDRLSNSQKKGLKIDTKHAQNTNILTETRKKIPWEKPKKRKGLAPEKRKEEVGGKVMRKKKMCKSSCVAEKKKKKNVLWGPLWVGDMRPWGEKR